MYLNFALKIFIFGDNIKRLALRIKVEKSNALIGYFPLFYSLYDS